MQVNKELLKGSTATMILSLLDRQPMYGYEMIAAIHRESGGIFAFKEGTLYPILHTLESEGHVESYWTGEEGSRKRKYYRITHAGGQHLLARRQEWAVFSTAVNRVLGEGQA